MAESKEAGKQEQSEEAIEQRRCRDAGDGDEPRPPSFWSNLRQAALEPPPSESPIDFWGRALFWVVLAYYGSFYIGLTVSRS